MNDILISILPHVHKEINCTVCSTYIVHKNFAVSVSGLPGGDHPALRRQPDRRRRGRSRRKLPRRHQGGLHPSRRAHPKDHLRSRRNHPARKPDANQSPRLPPRTFIRTINQPNVLNLFCT